MKAFPGVAAICITLAACSTTSTMKPEVAAPAPLPAAAPSTSAAAQPVETEAQRLERLRAALAKKSVYFDFDDFTLKSEYQGTVQDNADFMRQFGRDTLVLQGNADERGSREYNLALGQKRAETVRKSLQLMGIPADRIESVSFGKEKPRLGCHEEKCWQENRRVDFVHAVK